MKNVFKRGLVLSILVLLFGVNSINISASINTRTAEEKGKSILDIATEDGRFTILVKLLEKVDLVDTLKNDGPFTVFAPTDDAFKKLGVDKLNELSKVENKELLKDILLYHVYPKGILAKDIVKLNNKDLNMLNSKKAKIEVKNNDVYIDGAKIIITDIIAQNGVIHVVDTVMIP